MAKSKKAAAAATAEATVEAAVETTAYEVVEPIRHDGDDYIAGESIDLTAAQAEQLLQVNAIKALPVKAAATQPAPTQPVTEPAADTTQTDTAAA